VTEYAANLLLDRLTATGRWPAPFEREAIARVARFAAFRESDREALRLIHGWDAERPYAVDPVGNRIAEAYADMLFGENPTFTPANERDDDNLKRIIETSDLPTELHHAEQINSSEGEVWWRAMSAGSAITPAPQITFHSREEVVPHFVGATLVAVAFVSEFEAPRTGQAPDERVPIYRHLEIQSLGRIENALYLGSKEQLGERVELDSFSETDELFEVWDHGLPGIAAGRILNKRGRQRDQGKSDLDGIEDLLLGLNEALTIGMENVRLVAKKRAVVPMEALAGRSVDDLEDAGDGSLRPTGRATFDAGEDVLAINPLDAELGKEGAGPFKVLEYSFDAEQLVVWQDALITRAAHDAGLTVHFIGTSKGTEGEATSGTALRTRLLPAINSGRGRGRPWDRELPRALLFAQLLDAMQPGSGGYGRSYADAGTPPSVERNDPFPRDELEETTRHAAAVQGEIESRRTAVEALHPDWTDEQVDEELDNIRGDSQDRARSMGFAGIGEQPGDQGEAS
jgi:hypothetical protein